jgi:hypothetical protein
MNPSDFRTILEIARVALQHKVSGDIVARELDLSDEELDRIFSIIEDAR